MSRRRMEDMDEPRLKRLMARCGEAVERELPPGPGRRGKALFVLVVFGEDGIGQYTSNARRSDTIMAMREFADRLEQMEDVPR